MKIKKIISVEDTREWEEGPDDRWYPVPGSGVKNNCGRCGREHEVHAIVLLDDDKSQMIVGTGCMKADEAEVATQVRSILNSQKTLRKLRCELRKKIDLAKRCVEIRNQVAGLNIPEIVVEDSPGNGRLVGRKVDYEGQRTRTYWCGDGFAFMRYGSFSNDHEDLRRVEEREQCARNSWTRNREREFGMTSAMEYAAGSVSDLEKRIKKIEEKIAAKLKE